MESQECKVIYVEDLEVDYEIIQVNLEEERWNTHHYKNHAEVVYINVGRVEEISFISDKNCKYAEKENWKQERIKIWKKQWLIIYKKRNLIIFIHQNMQ